MEHSICQALDGWSVAPIFSAHTGFPFSIFDGTNAYYLYNRMILVNPASITYKGPKNPAPIAGLPNQFTYIDLNGQAAGIGSYANPITGTADFGPYPS